MISAAVIPRYVKKKLAAPPAVLRTFSTRPTNDKGARLRLSTDQLPLFIGLRYSFSRARNRFISVVSMVSLLGMALGVASLITVLSVMNGFAGELRDRILSLVPHGEIRALKGNIGDWPGLVQRLQGQPGLEGIAPFVSSKVLLASRVQVRGAQLVAVDVTLETSVSRVAQHITAGSFTALSSQPYGVVLGSLLARSARAITGAGCLCRRVRRLSRTAGRWR